jgi:hypothetical protein
MSQRTVTCHGHARRDVTRRDSAVRRGAHRVRFANGIAGSRPAAAQDVRAAARRRIGAGWPGSCSCGAVTEALDPLHPERNRDDPEP